jgi:amino acid adenylation domain-containing protein
VQSIPNWLDQTALRFPEHTAIEDSAGRSICYRDLARLSQAVAQGLVLEYGLERGDRVGILMAKSVDAMVAFHAVLRSGAAYVPIDSSGPVRRAAVLFQDCAAKVVLVDENLAQELRNELELLASSIALLVIPREAQDGAAWRIETTAGEFAIADVTMQGNDVAFMLYTSGSTGKPKAVVLTHANVVDFIDWCSATFAPTEHDRFATQSPLHFSLPVFNFYLACKHGGAVCLIDDRAARVPEVLAQLIAKMRVTVWFSAPAALSQLAQSDQLRAVSSLRLVMWAGEVLHTAKLRDLRAKLPPCRCVNVLGSTETHIMAHYEVPDELPPDSRAPIPVGTVGTRFRSRIIDEDGNDIAPGADGELCLTGPGVTAGYWNAPEVTARVFFTDAQGRAWYRTGDMVRARADGNLLYRGRRDRMVKKRGNRIELGEIESCLHAHSNLNEVAVVAIADEAVGLKVQAFVVARHAPHPSIIELKAHCARSLPNYMVPDSFAFPDALPRTSTGKVDYPKLQEMLGSTRQELPNC